MAPSFGFTLATLLATSQNNPDPISLEVCLSPGCVADGAETTLRRLQALAPPDHVSVIPGGCVSGCGKGPIVRENEKIVHKRVGGDALLELLLGEPTSESLARGLDKVLEAEQVASRKDYETAVKLYQEGIREALPTALELASREEKQGDDKTTPSNLEWIVQGYRGEAGARLAIGDKEGSFEAATKACELSRDSNPLCWELLATVCQARDDSQGELKALHALFALPTEENMPRDVANRRRELGFRLAKLERESK